MQIRLMQAAPARVAGAILLLSLATATAYAQTTPAAADNTKPGTSAPTVKSAPPTNAELKQQVDSLREQVQKLQQAQQDATPAQPHGPPASATNKAKDGMAKGQQGMQKGMAKGNQGMQKGMGMMDDMDMPMDKDDSMEMPPPDAKKPDPMSGGMSDM